MENGKEYGLFIEMVRLIKNEPRASQMTLGELISALKMLPKDKEMQRLCRPRSCRLSYSNLLLEVVTEEPATIEDNLLMLENECLGKGFRGYTHGVYTMQHDTPVWVSGYKVDGEEEPAPVKLLGIGSTIYMNENFYVFLIDQNN